MKKFWFSMPAKYRRGIAYLLIIIGLTTIAYGLIYLVFKGFDITSAGWVEQMDGEAQWAVEYSFGRLSE